MRGPVAKAHEQSAPTSPEKRYRRRMNRVMLTTERNVCSDTGKIA